MKKEYKTSNPDPLYMQSCPDGAKGRNDFRGGKIALNAKKWHYCYECHLWFLAEPATVVRCPHCGEDITIQ